MSWTEKKINVEIIVHLCSSTVWQVKKHICDDVAAADVPCCHHHTNGVVVFAYISIYTQNYSWHNWDTPEIIDRLGAMQFIIRCIDQHFLRITPLCDSNSVYTLKIVSHRWHQILHFQCTIRAAYILETRGNWPLRGHSRSLRLPGWKAPWVKGSPGCTWSLDPYQ